MTKLVSMSAWQKCDGGSCAMRIGFPALCRRAPCEEFSETRRRAWWSCGGVEKNRLWSVWIWVAELLRQEAAARARFVVRRYPRLSGDGGAASGLSDVWRREARALGMVGRQSVLHQTLCLSGGTAGSDGHDQRRGPRVALGLGDGQGVGEAVYARAVAARRNSRTRSGRDRRDLDSQRTQLSDRRQRPPAPSPDLVWRARTNGGGPGSVLPLAGPQEVSENSTGLDGYVEALWQLDAAAGALGRHSVRQVSHYAGIWARRWTKCAGASMPG